MEGIYKPLPFIIVGQLTWASAAFGLGFGSMKVETFLNEPFAAQIPLIAMENLESDELRVRLASNADFMKAGIERPYYLNSFDFEVIPVGDGSGLVKINSTESIKEPFVVFLVEITWSNGRILKEFTALMDLPPLRIQPRSVAKIKLKPPVPPIAKVQDATEVPSPVAKNLAKAVTVQPDDTLWSIASTWAKENDMSVYQAIISMYEQNPTAFIGKNIHHLVKGATLNIKQPETVWISSEEAFSRFQDYVKMKEENGQMLAEDKSLAIPALVISENDDINVGTMPKPSLKTSTAPVVPANTSARLQDVKTENANLLALQDELKYENLLLRESVQDNQSQIAELKAIIAASKEPKASVRPKQQLAALFEAPVGSDNKKKHFPKAATTLAPQNQIVPAVTISGSMGMVPAIASGALGLLLGAFVPYTLLARRRRNEIEEEELEACGSIESNSSDTVHFTENEEAKASLNVPIQDPLPEEAAKESEEFNLEDALDEISQEGKQREQPKQNALKEASVDDTEQSPLSDADVYLAYKRYDQAEDILKTALNDDPNNLAILEKLLGVYLETKQTMKLMELSTRLPGDYGEQHPELWAQMQAMVEDSQKEARKADSGIGLNVGAPSEMPVADPEIEEELIVEAQAIDFESVKEDEAEIGASVIDLSEELNAAMAPEEEQDANALRLVDDEVITNSESPLSIAKTCIEMGDVIAAKELLNHILDSGSEAERVAAQQILDELKA